MHGVRRFILPLLLVGIFTVIGLFRLGLIDRVAPAIAFALPLLACGVALARALRDGVSAALVVAALLVCTAAASLFAVNHGVRAALPPAVEVSHGATGRLDLPENAVTFDVFVLASVSSNPGAQGRAEIELSRAGHVELLEATFSRGAVTSRAGRRARITAGAAHDEERFRVELPGQGPVAARLRHVEGSIGTALRVSAAPVPPSLRLVETALVLAGFGIVLWDALRDRSGRVAHFAGGAAAFALYLERGFSPNDAISGVLAAVLVAAIGAGGTAIVTSLLARSFSRLRQSLARRPVSEA